MTKPAPSWDELQKLLEAGRRAAMLTPEEIESLRAEFKRDGERLRKPTADWRPERLTPEEIAELRRKAKASSESSRRAFAHLRPKKD